MKRIRPARRRTASSGARHSTVALLGEALLNVEALSPSVPEEAADGAAWAAVEAALTDYLGETVETVSPGREGFWK